MPCSTSYPGLGNPSRTARAPSSSDRGKEGFLFCLVCVMAHQQNLEIDCKSSCEFTEHQHSSITRFIPATPVAKPHSIQLLSFLSLCNVGIVCTSSLRLTMRHAILSPGLFRGQSSHPESFSSLVDGCCCVAHRFQIVQSHDLVQCCATAPSSIVLYLLFLYTSDPRS